MEIFSPSPQRNDLIAGGDRERVGELPSRLLQPLRQAERGEALRLRLPMQSHIQGFNEENSNELSNKFKAIMTSLGVGSLEEIVKLVKEDALRSVKLHC